MASTLYEAWVTRLRVSWMGAAARRIFGAFAAVLGDFTVDWAQRGIAQQHPVAAYSQARLLIASERQLDIAPDEDPAIIAEREPYWLQINKFRGRGLGLLLGLHFSGFPGAVIVQQNGRAMSLSLPLPPFVENWDPTPSLVVTPTSELAVPLHSDVDLAHSVSIGEPWWAFDSDTDFCSRYAVLFPGDLPDFFKTVASVEFDGTQDSVDFVWPRAFPDRTYQIGFSVTTTDGTSPVIYVPISSVKEAGARVGTTDRFTGRVDLIAWQLGANPYADLHPADLQRLLALIDKWGPQKATCRGVYALVQGVFMGWPVAPWGSHVFQPSTVVNLTGVL